MTDRDQLARMREAFALIVASINTVDQVAKEAEYTDLDAVWSLLYDIRDRIIPNAVTERDPRTLALDLS